MRYAKNRPIIILGQPRTKPIMAPIRTSPPPSQRPREPRNKVPKKSTGIMNPINKCCGLCKCAMKPTKPVRTMVGSEI